MSKYTEEIINYIDNLMTKDASAQFKVKIENNVELKDEFLFILALNRNMKGKLISEEINSDLNYPQIEKEAKEDVNEFLKEGKKDEEVLNYMSSAFPENNITTNQQIKEIEDELKYSGINSSVEDLVQDFEHETIKDIELLKLVHSEPSGSVKTLKPEAFPKRNINIRYNKEKGRRNLYYWTASVAAGLILFFVLNKVLDNTAVNDRIFADYHPEPAELIGVQIRGGEQETNLLFNEATALYLGTNYAGAFALFEQLSTDDKSFVQALYNAGIVQFESEKYKESIAIFNQVISDFDTYELESKWFISLAYIKINEFDSARPYLNDLANQKGLYQVDAKKILKQIVN